MFTAAKDALSSQAARSYLNRMIKRYGEVRSLRIDSAARAVEVVCQLEGEDEPVTVRIDNYRLGSNGPHNYIEIVSCSCSRTWIQHLIEDHARGRRIELPAWAAAIL